MISNKRIHKEISELTDIYELSFHNNSIDYRDKTVNLMIYINSKIMIEFLINRNYPFYPPSVFLNNRRYPYYLTQLPNELQEYLKYRKNDNCLCCFTITCVNKWLPNYKIAYIINEIKYIHLLILNYYQKKVTNKLCNIKNIMDMNTLINSFIGL